MSGTRGLSTATLEKAARVRAQEKLQAQSLAEQEAAAAGLHAADQEDLPDEEIDKLPFEDDAAVAASEAANLATMRALDERVGQAIGDTQGMLTNMRAHFQATMQKHIDEMARRGMRSKLTAKPRHTMPSRDDDEDEYAPPKARPADPVALTANTATASASAPAVRKRGGVDLGGPASPSRASAAAAAVSFTSPQAQPRPQLSQAARSNHAPVALSSPIFSSPSSTASSESRPSTANARPSSASRRANTPRERLEQAKLFSDSVYGGSKAKGAGGRLDFDPTRDELTGAVLPAALTKQRATSAPYRPQHSKPSFTQPSQPLSPITTASQLAQHAPSQQPTDDSRPSTSSSVSSQSSSASLDSRATTPGTKSASRVVPKKKAATVVATSSVAAAAAAASASSPLFASPFAHIKAVPVPTASRSAAAQAASERNVAVLAATKAALTAAKNSPDLKPSNSAKSLPTTKGVSIVPTRTPGQPRARPPVPVAAAPVQPPSAVPTPVTAPVATHSVQQPSIPANRPYVAPSSVGVTQPASAALLVRQQLIAAQIALAASQPLEEVDLNAPDDDDDANGLHDTANSNEEVPALFARPWSAHARAEHSALNSARSRPQSAARVRPPAESTTDHPYASFSMPLHDPTLASQLAGQINVSSTYAKAFAQQKAAAAAAASAPRAQPTAYHSAGSATPRGTLPVAPHNPFLKKSNAFSGR